VPRRADHRAQRARRRGAAGRRLEHDPYGGEVVDGKLYGRAAAVSKSDFATYTFACARWRRCMARR
jgi:acetylornithine deacetylase/succinyl-diaminopimelate desuccinylase-like protein